ncbi:zinc finger FYVE domain-containing protein 9 [Musca vetustissima]|uniref:zinc finger FYVE domain-containing protein 9 n=1 Tax=Musca vetustissima TaxID=27455 RepID=UPI002AB7DFDA|nr:zinc finger FYVE domain-containing protein 9 [Musca vetustissima]
MDLVDIDQVLDNLELHEEAANEQQRKRLEEAKQKETSSQPKSTSTTNGFVSQSKEGSGFKAVSQVFNSLDDYCKNVESLEATVTSVSSLHSSNDFISRTTDYREKSGFQPSQLVATSRQELEEYEHEVEESKDIHKFTEKPRSRNKLTAAACDSKDSPDESTNSQSSESLTTSSNSTFSSGPSLEPEDSLEEPTPLTNSSPDDVVEDEEDIKNTTMEVVNGSNENQLTAKEEENEEEEAPSGCSANNTEDQSQAPAGDNEEATYLSEISNSLDLIQQNLQSTTNVEDLTQGLSSISLTSANLQSQSVLHLETSLSSSMGKVLENLSDTNLSSALSQTRDMPIAANNTPNDESSEAANTSVEVLTEHSVPEVHHPDGQQQLQEQQPQQVHQIYDYNQAKFEDANSFVQQPVTFCSTMDEISDAELDSMLQEMDIDDEAVSVQPQAHVDEIKEESHVNDLNAVSQTVSHSADREVNIYAEHSDDVLSNVSSGDHPNGDSFSQASTVEFSEIRPQNHQDLPECEDNIGISSAVSSYSNSESSSLEGDIIQAKNIDAEDSDPSRPQRPTSLDLPAIQALDIYASAGQTPPGAEQHTNPTDTTTAPQQEELQATPSPDEEPKPSPVANEVAEATGYSEDPHANLGKIPPIWVPDNMATGCMQCAAKFTMIKRRHHCRACGKVLCSVCCSQKFKLEFLSEPESRVCVQCYLILTQRQTGQSSLGTTGTGSAQVTTGGSLNRSPNPNNPMEYCSTIPPYRQVSADAKTPPTVIVPVGVLKKDNGSYSSTSSNSSGQKARKRKSVMFSDGIAPGSDLANIDQWNEQPKQARRQSSGNRNANSNKPATPRSEYITDATTMGLVAQLFRGSIPPMAAAATVNTASQQTGALKSSNQNSANTSPVSGGTPKATDTNNRPKRIPPSGCDDDGCFIPEAKDSLPPIVVAKDETGCDFDYKDVVNNYDLVKRLQNETLKFAVQKNFFVFVKIVHLKCCLNRTVINFTTCGMHHVGNDEIIILLEFEPPTSKEATTNTSSLIPRDIFVHLNEIYNNAEAGNPIQELSHTSPTQSTFLGSRDYGGFIFIRPTFQCMLDIIHPDKPYLIGILIHRFEIPWAKIFPLRLMLRLGAQYRYYPCPHVSMCNRESVYAEIAQTIINFLADFRNYSYTLPFIRGMYIHMEDRQTTVVIPRNRLDDVIKAINNSSEHILAFGGNFSKKADGHLVCMQNVNDERAEMYAYSTQAINIQGQPRKVTGASFFILNESLKANSGLSGKCSIVEDGLMVQILPSKMEEVRESLKNQKDVTIVCGPIDADEQHTEIVCLKWVENDKEFNIGVKSPIDDRLMDGVSSMRVHASFSYSNSNYSIRLTDIYVIQHVDWYNTNSSTLSAETTSDVTRMTEQIARSTSMALVPFLDLLVASKSTKIGLRATLHQDNVCYEAGARGSKLPPLYMNALDNHLIPTLHGISSGIEEALILELIFYILNV